MKGYTMKTKEEDTVKKGDNTSNSKFSELTNDDIDKVVGGFNRYSRCTPSTREIYYITIKSPISRHN